MGWEKLIYRAADAILNSRLSVALTGAGISVESGIPDFRSAGGLWSRFDPAEYATIKAFRENPEKVWNMLRELETIVSGAKPNGAHKGMGELERMGYLDCVITQNVDNLHQAGGSKNVIEYHGNSRNLSCLRCGRSYKGNERRGADPPRCECDMVLKPDVIFFGEAISQEAMDRSFRLASSCQAVLVVGTSAVVYPANSIPSIAKKNGAKIIEINTERTHLTDSVTDIFLQGQAGTVITRLVEEIKKRDSDKRLDS